MRHYRYEATDETIEALRLLRRAWRDFTHAADSLTIRLTDGETVRIAAQRDAIAEEFEVFRLRAFTLDASAEAGGDVPADAGALGLGGNDVVLFSGATWTAGPGAPMEGSEGLEGMEVPEGSTVQFSGHPGQIPEEADAVCITTDAVVVASSVGTGLLVRLGVRPFSLDVVDDADEIAKFVRTRGYTG